MIVLGMLLVLIAVGTAVFAVVAPSDTAAIIPMQGIGITLSATPLAMYVAGAGSVVLLFAGLSLTRRGLRHTRDRRKELRDLREAQSADAGASTRGGERSYRAGGPEVAGKDTDAERDSGTSTGSSAQTSG